MSVILSLGAIELLGLDETKNVTLLNNHHQPLRFHNGRNKSEK